MIHYHGLPITPASSCLAAISGGHAFISHAHPDQLAIALESAQSFALDNGAFSAWSAGRQVDWNGYYDWVQELHRYPSFDFAVIPDVIDGSEEDNDSMLEQFPWGTSPIGAPVWHLNESIERLKRLARTYYRVCLGSSGDYATVGNQKWFVRMAEAMNAITDKSGRPICKIHGLRMLDPEIYTRFPFSSADSTNIGRNIGIDKAWNGNYTPPSKDVRAMVMRERIESHQSPMFWERQRVQQSLLV